jgi:hypothetical protein
MKETQKVNVSFDAQAIHEDPEDKEPHLAESGNFSLKSIIRKECAGMELTIAERRTLLAFRRRNPAWSKVYEDALSAGSVRITADCDPKERIQIQRTRPRMDFGLVRHED